MKQAVQVTILGQHLTLRSDVPAEEIQRVADFINRTAEEISASGRAIDSLNVAILALMNIGQSYLQLRDGQQAGDTDAVVRLNRLGQRIDAALKTAGNSKKSGTTSLYGDF